MKATVILFALFLLTPCCAVSQSNWTIQFDTTAWKTTPFPHLMIVGPDTGAFYLKKQSYNISLQLDRKAECCAMKDTLQKLVQLQDQDKKDYEAGISMLIEENGNLQTIDRNNQVMLQSKDKQIKRLKKEKVGGIILAGIIAFLAGRL